MSKQHIVENCTSQHSLQYLMFQNHGLVFVPDLISGLKKTSQDSSLT